MRRCRAKNKRRKLELLQTKLLVLAAALDLMTKLLECIGRLIK